MSLNMMQANEARAKLEALLSEVNAELAVHDNIKADDDQYEDPQEWWLRPLKRQLQEAITSIDINS